MADDLADLDRRITDAMTALRSARAVVQHSANSATRWQEEMAEHTLNRLLDQRPRRGINERPEALAGATVAPRHHW
jgi:uncharacterized protein (DUF924 family)